LLGLVQTDTVLLTVRLFGLSKSKRIAIYNSHIIRCLLSGAKFLIALAPAWLAAISDLGLAGGPEPGVLRNRSFLVAQRLPTPSAFTRHSERPILRRGACHRARRAAQARLRALTCARLISTGEKCGQTQGR
jgi:hypothetical protein